VKVRVRVDCGRALNTLSPTEKASDAEVGLHCRRVSNALEL
jgi:hypothetical protein